MLRKDLEEHKGICAPFEEGNYHQLKYTTEVSIQLFG